MKLSKIILIIEYIALFFISYIIEGTNLHILLKIVICVACVAFVLYFIDKNYKNKFGKIK